MSSEDTVSDFLYELPPECIAQSPTSRREQSRMMVIDRKSCAAHRHSGFDRLVKELRGDELIVFNDTRVVPARLRGVKQTGGRVELLALAEGPQPATFVAMAKSAKKLRAGGQVIIAGSEQLAVLDALGGGRYLIGLPQGVTDLWAFLQRHGSLPLPPYIERPDGPGAGDLERYQTTFARHAGAVAAPTAGLHFSDELLTAMALKGCELAYVTLHVGPGTFLPVRVEHLADHEMHSERYVVSEATADAVRRARAEGRPILAVGTTVVRTLESVARLPGNEGAVRAGSGATDLFIRPPYEFRVVDQLVTNFHLPGSTLLMLVAAFCGRDHILGAYREAIAQGYRFYSYGDGMLIR